MEFHFQEVKSPYVERMKKITKRMYGGGMVKITPSDCVLPSIYKNHAHRITNFEVRENDVWIVAYPKCGTTWTQEMVWLIVNDLDFEGAVERIDVRVPFLEYYCVTYPDEEKDFGTPDTVAFADSLKSPRCIKSHLPKDLLPLQLWTKKPKIVYATRSAKDVLVSDYYFHQLVNGYTGELDEFVEMFMAENVLFWDPFWKHILDFWKLKDEPHVLINSYEEMKKDLPSVIRRTTKFLGKAFSEEQVTQLADHLSFQKMKKNEAVNHTPLTDLFKKKYNVTHEFMRSGEAGSYRKDLSPEQVARLDNWSLERVAGTDYPFIG